jgi:hypothetical protein
MEEWKISDEKSTLEKREICRTITESFLSTEPRIRFTFSDILNTATFYQRLNAEVNSIYESAHARKGRSIISIKDSSFRGKVAEAWYVENQPFPGNVSWTDQRWHDIIVNESKYVAFNGSHIEIKTVSNWNTSSFVSMFLTNWDSERDKWFKSVKSTGTEGTFVQYVESGCSDVWWEYFGTKCIDPSKKITGRSKNRL